MSNALPHNVIYNGPQNVGDKTLMVFTDLITEGTFTVPPAEADFSGILSALVLHRKPLRDRMNQTFSTELPAE